MIVVDRFSRKAIYEQIIDEIEKQVVSGVIKELDQLPSIRELSSMLSINPNTIQKAFMELDRREIIISTQGRGCFIAQGAKEKIRQRGSSKLDELEKLVDELCNFGVDKKLIISTVNTVYEKKNSEERKSDV